MKGFEMKDFYRLAKNAIKNGQTAELLKKWRGDPNIDLKAGSRPISISPRAFYAIEGGKDSLEHIWALAKKLHREVAFAGVVCGNGNLVRIFKGSAGSYGLCDWNAGNLLKRARAEAATLGGKVCLGHTHPALYGAVCSNIYWTRGDLLYTYPGKLSKLMLSTGLYKKYGGDYAELFLRWREESMSDISIICSPLEGQLGIFRLKNFGRVVYHPWKIGQS